MTRYPVTWSLPDRGRSRRFARRDFVSLCRTKSRTAICTVPGFFPIFDGPYRRVPRSPYLYENRTNENRAVCPHSLSCPPCRAFMSSCSVPRGVAAYAPDAYSLHAVHQPAGSPLRVAQARVVAQRTARCSHAAGDVRPVSLAGIPGAARSGRSRGICGRRSGVTARRQAIGYVSVVLAPDWLGRLRQRRYEERVLSGREKLPDPARRC